MISLLNNFFDRAALSCIVFLSLMFSGGCAMSADVKLKWEWPADRTIEDKIVVKIKSIKKEGGGFFGLKKSPSLANSFPGPVIVTGSIENSNGSIQGKVVEVTVPQLEISGITEGDYAMLGLVETGICVCIVKVDSPDTDLSGISCK